MTARGSRVVVCGSEAKGFCLPAIRVIESLGLVPLIHEGARLLVRESSADAELRDDFYKSEIVVVVLDSTDPRDASNNWALPELPNIGDRALLIYASGGVSSREVQHLNLPIKVEFVKTSEEFLSKLSSRLQQTVL